MSLAFLFQVAIFEDQSNMLSYHHGQSNALLSAGQEQYYSRPLVLDSSKNKPLTCWNTWDELTRMSAEELQDPENDVNGNVLCSRTHALLIMKPRYSRKLFMTSSSVGTLRFWLFIAQQEFVGHCTSCSQIFSTPRSRDGRESQADSLQSIILQFSKNF